MYSERLIVPTSISESSVAPSSSQPTSLHISSCASGFHGIDAVVVAGFIQSHYQLALVLESVDMHGESCHDDCPSVHRYLDDGSQGDKTPALWV